MPAHRIENDGYCNDCRTVPCREPSGQPVRREQGAPSQLDRIEAMVRQIARKVGVEVPGDES